MGDPAPNDGEIPPVQAAQLPAADAENHAPAIVAQPAMAVRSRLDSLQMMRNSTSKSRTGLRVISLSRGTLYSRELSLTSEVNKKVSQLKPSLIYIVSRNTVNLAY